MPIPLKVLDITNIVITNGGSNGWIVDITNIGYSKTLGTKANGGAYTDGAEVDPAERTMLFIDTSSGAYDGGDTTYLTVSYDGTSVEIHFFSNMATAYDDGLYIDSNGVLYTDFNLTTPYSDVDFIEDSLLTADVVEEEDVYDELEDTVQIYDDDIEEESEYELTDSIELSDEMDSDNIQELDDEIVTSDTFTELIGSAWSERSNPSTSNWSERK